LQPGDDLGARQPSAVAVSAIRGTPGKCFVQNRELDVLRPEIVPPLRHAMRFVDGEQRDLGLRQQLEETGVTDGSGAT